MNPHRKKPTLRDILPSVKENRNFDRIVSNQQKEYF